jgi:pimeloyl-ACP methyl ester carboxylesterase
MRRDDRVYRESVQAFVVGKDFGAMPAYDFALRHPDRTCGVVYLSSPSAPHVIQHHN